jgi:hypothetical protein
MSLSLSLAGCGYAVDSPEQAVRDFLRYGPGSLTPSYTQIRSRLCDQVCRVHCFPNGCCAWTTPWTTWN